MYDIWMSRPLAPAGATTIDNWPPNKFFAHNLLTDQCRVPSSSFFADHNLISNHRRTPSSTLLFGHVWSPFQNQIFDRHYSVTLSASLKSVHSFQWVPCGCDDYGVVLLFSHKSWWTQFSFNNLTPSDFFQAPDCLRLIQLGSGNVSIAVPLGFPLSQSLTQKGVDSHCS